MNGWPRDVPPLPETTPRDRPVSLLLRHGERPPIGAGELGGDLSLTLAGRHQAEALGHALGSRLRGLHTSPVRRCRETAAALGVGSGGCPEGHVDDRTLGEPGVFVVDPALAWTNWRARGHEGVVEHLAWGHDPLPGLADPAAAAHKLAAHLAGGLERAEPGFHVFITHDAVLLPAVARLISAVADRKWWPRYLEGAALWRDEGAVCVAYRHVSARIDIPAS